MSVTLEYELGQADLEAFFEHHASHAPYIAARNRRMRWVWAGIFTLLALAYSTWSPGGSVAFLGLAVAFLLFYGRLNRWWYVRHNRRVNAGPDGPRLGQTKLELAGGQLLVEAPEGSSRLDLAAVRRIDESDSHYFIYLGPVSAVIVPKAVGTADAFVRALRSGEAAA
jgi:hypothetical protein